MASEAIIAHRKPEFRIPRISGVEPGSLVNLYWNGSISRGEGVSGGHGAIDYTRPIHAAPMWSRGHPQLFGGGFLSGGFASLSCDFDPSHGFLRGPFLMGGFLCGGGYWSWTPSNIWRPGVYRLAARIADSLGNEQSVDIASWSVWVLAAPRPCPKAWVASLDAGTLTIGWHHSPDFQPA